MQLGFDFLYDDELEKVCHSLGLEKYAKIFVLLPELILFTDSLLKLITGIYENGMIVVDRKVIIKHYLRHGFLYDIISYFPLVIQTLWKTYFHEFNVFWIKMLQLMMFCKLKRVSIALSNFEEIVSSKGKSDYWLSGARLLLNVFFISHLNACAWHALAYYYPFGQDLTWLKKSGVEAHSWPRKYCVSLYFSVGTFVRSSSESQTSPQNTLEYLYSIFVLLMSAALFAYIIFTIQEILTLRNKKSHEYK